MRTGVAAVAAALLATGAAACGSGKTTGGTASSTATGAAGAGAKLKVGLAFDIGGRGDKSFNDAAYAGLAKAQQQLGVEGKYLEAKEGESDNDKIQRLDLLAKSGYNPIVAVGFVYANAVKAVAPRYPKVRFAIVDDASVQAPNLTNLVFSENEGSYLVGAAAALKSKTGTIGFIGGVQTPLIKKFEVGYVAGAKKINPKINVKIQYISQPPDFSGFKDPAKGKTIAEGMYDAGADVVYHAAGLSGVGLFQAAVEKKKLAIGVDSDQYQAAPPEQKPYILTSMLKRVDTAVFDFVKAVKDGSVQAGPVQFSLKNDGVGYSQANAAAISDITAKLDDLKQQIIDGKITVPSA